MSRSPSRPPPEDGRTRRSGTLIIPPEVETSGDKGTDLAYILVPLSAIHHGGKTQTAAPDID